MKRPEFFAITFQFLDAAMISELQEAKLKSLDDAVVEVALWTDKPPQDVRLRALTQLRSWIMDRNEDAWTWAPLEPKLATWAFLAVLREGVSLQPNPDDGRKYVLDRIEQVLWGTYSVEAARADALWAEKQWRTGQSAFEPESNPLISDTTALLSPLTRMISDPANRLADEMKKVLGRVFRRTDRKRALERTETRAFELLVDKRLADAIVSCPVFP